jgi:uncharacterized short protein YbdD (DUF466 family)
MRTGDEKNFFIWDQVKNTNPKYTKAFTKFGGKELTTIDPMYQIQVMTGMFGPVGKGWSYEVSYHYTDKNVFAEVKVKYLYEIYWNEFGPVSSVQALYKKNGGLDDEAPKKAMTDALTKAFSHLGVSADVFLGLFDNNKYVQEMKAKFAAPSNIKVINTKELNDKQSNVDRKTGSRPRN